MAYVVPGLLGYERYVITGGSMSGTFESGSVVFEKPVPVKDLVVGDVITYLPPPDSGVSTLVTHRIIEIAPGKDAATVFQTQGDANPDPDPWTLQPDLRDPAGRDAGRPLRGLRVRRPGRPPRAMLVIGVPRGPHRPDRPARPGRCPAAGEGPALAGPHPDPSPPADATCGHPCAWGPRSKAGNFWGTSVEEQWSRSH